MMHIYGALTCLLAISITLSYSYKHVDLEKNTNVVTFMARAARVSSPPVVRLQSSRTSRTSQLACLKLYLFLLLFQTISPCSRYSGRRLMSK